METKNQVYQENEVRLQISRFQESWVFQFFKIKN